MLFLKSAALATLTVLLAPWNVSAKELMPVETASKQGKSAALLIAQVPEPSSEEVLLEVEGALETGDAVLEDDSSLYDEYEFEGQAGQAVIITLESNEFG